MTSARLGLDAAGKEVWGTETQSGAVSMLLIREGLSLLLPALLWTLENFRAKEDSSFTDEDIEAREVKGLTSRLALKPPGSRSNLV